MLINKQVHVDLFRQLVELIEAYRKMGLKIDSINIATVLDHPKFAASWGSTVWTLDDIQLGTANIKIMQRLVGGGPGTMRDVIFNAAIKRDPTV